jgi:hypothetical protein
MLIFVLLTAVTATTGTSDPTVLGRVTAQAVGPIGANTVFSMSRWRKLFPKAKITSGYCLPSDVPIREEDAANVDLGDGAFLHICRRETGRVWLVTVGRRFIGYQGLRVDDKWRADLFDKAECRPEPNFWTYGTFNRVTCRKPSEKNIGYEFTVPTFAYGNGKPQIIDYEAGVLSSISWRAPWMP